MALSDIWQAALVVLAALIPGAAYVSVINDLTDREDDAAAGKPNRLAGQSTWVAWLLVAVTVAAGIVVSWLWRKDTLLLTMYLAAWLAFSLYSLPPFRWKTRGLAGVLCDASGANLFPTLVAVTIAYRAAGHTPEPAWFISVGAWGFANGLRGILWHQLTDREHDRKAGVRTFAERHPARVATFVGTWIAFPIELAALGVMLWKLRSAWPVAFLVIYSLLAALRVHRWSMNAVIVAPKPRFLIVLHEYYDVYLPLAILAASASRFPRDFLILGAHLLVFPLRKIQTLRDTAKLIRYR